MIPAILAAAGGITAAGLGVAAAEGAAAYAGGQLLKTAAGFVLPRAAATVGLGATAAALAPWVVGGITVWQLGKLGCKLLDSKDGDKK